jgi:hypothetical protein
MVWLFSMGDWFDGIDDVFSDIFDSLGDVFSGIVDIFGDIFSKVKDGFDFFILSLNLFRLIIFGLILLYILILVKEAISCVKWVYEMVPKEYCCCCYKPPTADQEFTYQL